MNMYKRPPLRVREFSQSIHKPVNLIPGTLLYTLLSKEPTTYATHVKRPIYRKEDYLSLLQKHYKELGFPYKEPDIPEYVPPTFIEHSKEPDVDYIDRVYLKHKILKNGIIRIKLDASFAALYEKYYTHCKQPPTKAIIQAYKSMGFSDEFLGKIKKSFAKKIEYQTTVAKLLERVFDKEPVVKKPKKKKEEILEEEREEQEEEEEEEEEDDIEDEGMDIEVEEDIDEQPQGEEEYFSDGGD